MAACFRLEPGGKWPPALVAAYTATWDKVMTKGDAMATYASAQADVKQQIGPKAGETWILADCGCVGTLAGSQNPKGMWRLTEMVPCAYGQDAFHYALDPGLEGAARVEVLTGTPTIVDGDAWWRHVVDTAAKQALAAMQVPADKLAPPPAPPAPRWEISEDGKHWVPYATLTDAGPMEAFAYARDTSAGAKGIVVRADIKASAKAGERFARYADAERATMARMKREGLSTAQPAKPTPEPWRPRVDDWDLLEDV